MTFAKLPHTGMWVPTSHLGVTALHESDDQDTGTIRVATLHYDQTFLGYAVTAQQIPTRFVPAGPGEAEVTASFLGLAYFADLTEPTPAQVLDYLIGEHEWERVVRSIQARRRYALRLIDVHELPLRAEAVEISDPYPRYETVRQALTQRTYPPEVARAELWVGQRWRQVHPTPKPTP